MENEIKVGDYCRTSAGKIFKCSEIVLGYIPKDENKTMIVQHIVKHSPNLIDLIECGDYVNGYKVDNIEKGKLIIGDTTQVIEQIVENEDIETVVTKEQMESITYKVTKM